MMINHLLKIPVIFSIQVVNTSETAAPVLPDRRLETQGSFLEPRSGRGGVVVLLDGNGWLSKDFIWLVVRLP